MGEDPRPRRRVTLLGRARAIARGSREIAPGSRALAESGACKAAGKAVATDCGRILPACRGVGADRHRCRRRDRVTTNGDAAIGQRSEEHTSELQSLMRISYAVFCLKKKKKKQRKKQP